MFLLAAFIVGYELGRMNAIHDTPNYTISYLLDRMNNLSLELNNWSQDIRSDLNLSNKVYK